MIPTPIQRALATLRHHRVPTLMIGGQASILYGGAEFSRDLDLVIAADPAALPILQQALADLRAELIAVPPLTAASLERGHAVHFRCQREDVAGLRLDLMTRPPRLRDMEVVWRRGLQFDTPAGPVLVAALEDLVQTKKTQRDKDWAIIGALVQADMVKHRDDWSRDRVLFWLRESRDPDDLIGLAGSAPDLAAAVAGERALIGAAISADRDALELDLAKEQIRGKESDRRYWEPLRAELERMRHEPRRGLPA